MPGKLRSRFLILLTEKERRDRRRIKTSEIAAETGISFPTVQRWLRDEVTKFESQVLEAFCDYLECEVGDLLYIEKKTDAENNEP